MNTTGSSESPIPDSENESNATEPEDTGSDSNKIWWRLLFMLILVVLYGVSRIVMSAVVVLQFFWVLFTAEPNEPLLKLGQSLATYTYQVIRYLTFNSEERPFPFDSDWPSGAPE